MLPGSLGFLELLAVPFGHLFVEKPHDVARQYGNRSRLARISHDQCGQVSVGRISPTDRAQLARILRKLQS